MRAATATRRARPARAPIVARVRRRSRRGGARARRGAGRAHRARARPLVRRHLDAARRGGGARAVRAARAGRPGAARAARRRELGPGAPRARRLARRARVAAARGVPRSRRRARELARQGAVRGLGSARVRPLPRGGRWPTAPTGRSSSSARPRPRPRSMPRAPTADVWDRVEKVAAPTLMLWARHGDFPRSVFAAYAARMRGRAHPGRRRGAPRADGEARARDRRGARVHGARVRPRPDSRARSSPSSPPPSTPRA